MPSYSTAGWFYAWRLTLFTLPDWGGGAAIAGGMPFAGLVLALALIATFFASIPITNRIGREWARPQYGRRLTGGVWWGIFWRVLVVSFVAGLVFTAVQVGATLYAARLEWSPEQML